MNWFLDMCIIIFYASNTEDIKSIKAKEFVKNKKAQKFFVCYYITKENMPKWLKRQKIILKAFGKKILDSSYELEKSEEYKELFPQDKIILKKFLAQYASSENKQEYCEKLRKNNDIMIQRINYFLLKLIDKEVVPINEIDFEVVGVLDKLGNPQLNEIFIVNENVLEEILKIKDETDLIVAKVDNVNDINKIAEDIKKELRTVRNVEKGKENFSVETPQEAIEAYAAILNVIKVVLIGIAAISLVVGGIGIMNTMYTAVLERTREIGVMKSIGARNSDILLIFLIESGVLGLIGGAIGVILGVGFSKLVELIAANAGYSIVKVSFPLFLIIGTLLFALVVGVIAGGIPAYRASKLKPVDALRYE